jgi:CPA2 family monovalent cation:H+ antiporter-2
MEAHGTELIRDIAVVTGVGAVTAMVARRLGQPSILGFLVAGLIVGPYIPIPLFADPERMTALAELGVVLVMFAVGLEFRIRRLAEILPVSGFTALVQIAALAWAGYAVGSAIGWSSAASFTLGATIAISSTMVVSAVLRAAPVDPDVRANVFGVLVVQDVVAIVLMAVVTTLASGEELAYASVGRLVGELSLLVVGLLVLGLLILPRLVRLVVRRFDSEVLVVLIAGAAFGLAGVAELFGYSVALGAFIAGMAVAESGRSEAVEHAIDSLRALFSAIFFVTIGMSVDPWLAWESLPLALGLTAVVIVGQFLSISIASMLSGSSLRRAVYSALALGQIGELSFILATIGIGGGVLPDETLPALVTVAAITAFTTPFLLKRGQTVLNGIDRLVPDRMQHVLAAYQSFVRRGAKGANERPLRRSMNAVLLDWAALVLIFAGAYMLTNYLPERHRLAVDVGAAILAVPFLVGLLRSGRRLAEQVRALARGAGDTGSPWHAVVESLVLLAVVILIGLPTGAVMRALMSGPWVQATLVAVVVLVLVVVGLRFRKVRPGYTSEVAQLALGIVDRLASSESRESAPDVFEPLAGLDYQPVPVSPGSPADGVTLAQLNLRCLTGATVVAIRRGESSTPLPTGHEVLRAGDVLALSGSEDAVHRARQLLDAGEASAVSSVAAAEAAGMP